MNLAEKLIQAIDKKARQLVVIGDVMIDVWAYGETGSCQEGCVKFITTQEPRVVCGGAANAAACVDAWWAQPARRWGRAFNDCPRKYRFVNKHGVVVFRYDDEEVLVRRSGTYEWMHTDILHSVEKCDGVLLSDYDKGFLTPGLIRAVVRICDRRCIPCVADCKRAGDLYEGCTIKANTHFFDMTENLDYSLVQSRGRGVIMTRGADVPLVYDTSAVPQGMRSGTIATAIQNLPPVICVNHVGAGDCFAAALTLSLAYGFPLVDAARIAHSAGRCYVQHPHNRAPSPSEVVADMAQTAPK